MKKTIVTILASMSFVMTGCVSTKTVAIPKAKFSQLASATIAPSQRPMPDHANFKPSNAMFGGIGGLAAVSDGNALISKNGVPDPAIDIGSELIGFLATQAKVAVSNVAVPVDSVSIKSISESARAKSDYVLDIQTVNWTCVYFPTNWNRYRMIYSVKLRLVDVRASELVAEGFYCYQTPEGEYNLTNDELYANNAELLRKQLAVAKKSAVEYFKANVLKVGG